MADDPKKPRHTLSDDAIQTRRGVGRRALLLGALGGTAALATTTGRAEAATDSDTGSSADPAGRGYTGVTDTDQGGNADRAGHGRRGGGGGGTTDSDNGNWTDAAGRGRGRGGQRTGMTDSDNGNQTDQGGYGRGRPRG